MTALHDLGASELVELYRARKLSPVEATRAVLARIAAWEPHLCATYALDADAALAAARASETRWQRGEPCGSIDGVPSMLKENIATRGTPTPLAEQLLHGAPIPGEHGPDTTAHRPSLPHLGRQVGEPVM